MLKAKPEFSLGVLKKYVATQDMEILNAIYGHYKEKLATKPDGFVEARFTPVAHETSPANRPELP